LAGRNPNGQTGRSCYRLATVRTPTFRYYQNRKQQTLYVEVYFTVRRGIAGLLGAGTRELMRQNQDWIAEKMRAVTETMEKGGWRKTYEAGFAQIRGGRDVKGAILYLNHREDFFALAGTESWDSYAGWRWDDVTLLGFDLDTEQPLKDGTLRQLDSAIRLALKSVKNERSKL